MARKPIKFDWEDVRKLAEMQCTRDEIASYLNVGQRTLRRRAEEDFGCPLIEKLEEWREGGKASLRRTQWLLAKKNTAMAIFLGKQVLGQRDDSQLNKNTKIRHEIVHYGDKEPKQWSEDDR